MKKTSLLALLFLLLQSCQYTQGNKAEKMQRAQKLDEASAFNVQLGMGYLKQGDTPRAKRKLLNAVELAPASADAQGALAYYFEKTGDREQAGKYYQRALALAPDSGSQLNNYGAFLCRSGKYAEAEKYFHRAVADVHYVNTAAAFENAGLCAEAMPDNEKAEDYFLRALEQDPLRKQSLSELVQMKLKQGNDDKALFYLQKYQEQTLNDSDLLALAIKTAHAAGKIDLEADYRVRISKLGNKNGVKDEFNNNDG